MHKIKHNQKLYQVDENQISREYLVISRIIFEECDTAGT